MNGLSQERPFSAEQNIRAEPTSASAASASAPSPSAEAAPPPSAPSASETHGPAERNALPRSATRCRRPLLLERIADFQRHSLAAAEVAAIFSGVYIGTLVQRQLRRTPHKRRCLCPRASFGILTRPEVHYFVVKNRDDNGNVQWLSVYSSMAKHLQLRIHPPRMQGRGVSIASPRLVIPCF